MPPLLVHRGGAACRSLAARLVYGSRVRRVLHGVRRDLAERTLDDAVARRRAAPAARRRRAIALRGFDCALRGALARDGETKPCLLRSLALFEEAHRQGFDARLQVGVRRAPDRDVEGHAWLVVDGRPFLEDEGLLAGFAVIASLPAD